MLYIKRAGTHDWQEWHAGEELPDVHGPVLMFQADGHELQMILAAMQRTAEEDN